MEFLDVWVFPKKMIKFSAGPKSVKRMNYLRPKIRVCVKTHKQENKYSKCMTEMQDVRWERVISVESA